MPYNKAELHHAAKIDQLYTKLVKQYNNGNWQKVCSLNVFLITKAERALKKGNGDLHSAILEVIAIADNYF